MCIRDRRAYRRPIEDDEIDRIFGVAFRAFEDGATPEDAYKLGFKLILASPKFLFRIEQDPDDDDEDGIRQLSDYELATRLSYFLWSSMPDKELFELAKQGKLSAPEVLEQQVQRMLKDDKARALVDNFAGQWLQLRDLAKLTPDDDLFGDFDDELRNSMKRETEMFFATMMREDRSVLEFLDADFTFVNSRLAKHYGMKNVSGDKFQRVELGERRRGVLTHASILMLTSNPGRTSPVKRGQWILDNFLGEPPPPPPDGVAELDEEADELGSLRERMEQHRSNESCAICHRKMDALGFGLENFDAIGAWRAKDGKFDIDASGTLPGGLDFDGPAELMSILVKEKKGEFSRCMTKKMLTYAIGRGLDSYDNCAVDKVLKELAANDYRFSTLVLGIVRSDPFQMRESRRED